MRTLSITFLLFLSVQQLYSQDLIEKAETAYRNRSYLESAQYYEEYLKLYSDQSLYSKYTLYTIARAYSLAGEAGKALDYLEKACIAYSSNHYRAADALWETDLANIRNTEKFTKIILKYASNYDLIVYTGDTALANNHFDFALIMYDSALLLNTSRKPKDLLFRLASTYAQLGSLSKAIQLLEEAYKAGYPFISRPKIDPNFKNLWNKAVFNDLIQRYSEPNTVYFYDFIKDVLSAKKNESIIYKGKKINMDAYGNSAYDRTFLSKLNFNFERTDVNQYLLIENGLELQECEIEWFFGDVYMPQIKVLNTPSQDMLYLWRIKVDTLLLNGNKCEIILDNIDVQKDFGIFNHKGTIVITRSNFNFEPRSYISGEIENLRIEYSNFIEHQTSIGENYLPEEHGNLMIDIISEQLEIRDCSFDCDVILSPSTIHKAVEIQENVFNGYFDSYLSNLPEINTYIPYSQFKKGLAIFSTIPPDRSPSGLPCFYCRRYAGYEKVNIEYTEYLKKLIQSNEESFNKLIQSYQVFYNRYKYSGDLESANAVNIAIMELYLHRLHSIYTRDGGLNNHFAWRKAQLLLWHQKHRGLSISLIALFLLFLGGAIIWKFTRKKKIVPSEKRLAAIVFSDIVGYTELMGKDEKLAINTLKVNNAIHITMLDRYNGRLLKEMGDGLLFSFGTASESVKFCIDVQKEIMEKDFNLRMGVHLGEVMFTKNDVFGDGVNIASRLENKAKPGGICISDTVYQNIRNLPEIKVDFLGEGDLKNVTSKIKMYNVRY